MKLNNNYFKQKVFVTTLSAIIFLISCKSTSTLTSKKSEPDSDKEVMGHIHSIFRAFIAGDSSTIRHLHADNWVGFTTFGTLKRGIDAYMQNIRDKKSTMVAYEIKDHEIKDYGDVTIVYYLANITSRINGADITNSFRSVDIYKKVNGNWIQVGSNLGPLLSFEDMSAISKTRTEKKN